MPQGIWNEPKLVTGVEKSQNAKTGPLTVTYAAQQSCPSTCPLRDAGCYAEQGPMGHLTRRLNKSNPDATPDDVARAEAALIDTFMSIRPMRLHAVGDCSTVSAVRIIRAACERYTARTGQPVFTYTHAWRTIPRHEWGSIVVRASCESAEDVTKAKALGYSAAIVVKEYPSKRAYDLAGEKIVPCPATTKKGVQCVSCRLCMREGVTVGFEAHGARSKTVAKIVTDLQAKGMDSESIPLAVA